MHVGPYPPSKKTQILRLIQDAIMESGCRRPRLTRATLGFSTRMLSEEHLRALQRKASSDLFPRRFTRHPTQDILPKQLGTAAHRARRRGRPILAESYRNRVIRSTRIIPTPAETLLKCKA